MGDVIRDRQLARRRFEQAENSILSWDDRMRARRAKKVPPLEPAPADLEISPAASVTLSTEWVSEALGFAHYTGWQRVVDEMAPLIEVWDNEDRQKKIRETMPELAEALKKLMESI